MILCGRADHGGAADVDLLDAAIEVRAGRYGLTEGVQVDHDELERLHVELRKLVKVIVLAGIRQDAGMNARVQGLDAAFEALREAGELFYRGDLNAQIRNLFRGGAGRDDFYSGLVEGLGKVLQTGLVVNANQCALDGLTIFAHGVGTLAFLAVVAVVTAQWSAPHPARGMPAEQ